MNLLLVESQEIKKNKIYLNDDRAKHIIKTLRAGIDSQITIGEINGNIGKAQITHITHNQVELDLITELTQRPPAPIPCTLILAMPRPKMLKRILQTVATMGVKQVHLIHSYRVEKSYWSTPLLTQQSIQQQFLLGLSQAKDTLMPTLECHQLFRPFVEDRLPSIIQQQRAIVAHPYNAEVCPIDIKQPTVLIIGPEGGFIPFEIDLLQQQQCTAVVICQRILRVETAIPVLLSRLFPL